MMTITDNRLEKIAKLLPFLIGAFFLLSGFLEITKNPATYPKTLEMGYPPYFILLLGIMKVAGAVSIWQNRYKWLKEWAFAGFAFDTIFAFVSGCAISSVADCLKSAVAFIIILITWFIYKREK